VSMIEVRGSPTSIRRAYDFFSFFYGLTVSKLERRCVSHGLAKATAVPGERVLEVAVGTGQIFAELCEQVGDGGLAVGLDLAPRMLAATRRRVLHANLVRADAQHLPFAAGSFDLLWSSYLLDLIPTSQLSSVLMEFRRVLRNGGRLLVVNSTKAGDALTFLEHIHTPPKLVPYLLGSCRPIHIEPFLREAQFANIERELLSGPMPSEVVLARKN
jgi:ubiquinone/menaquinone biosynthesis C-methylase UbiE